MKIKKKTLQLDYSLDEFPLNSQTWEFDGIAWRMSRRWRLVNRRNMRFNVYHEE